MPRGHFDLILPGETRAKQRRVEKSRPFQADDMPDVSSVLRAMATMQISVRHMSHLESLRVSYLLTCS